MMGYFKRFQVEQHEKEPRWWEAPIPRKRVPIFSEERKPAPAPESPRE